MGLGRIVKTYQGKDVIMAAADPYKVKHVEPVLKSSDVLARIFTLAPEDTIPWHYHQHCADSGPAAALAVHG